MTKKLLIIAAVAVMLAAATNAYAYYEAWDGWFDSGKLKYYGATFEYTEGSGVLEDTTYGSVDSFFVSAVCISTFTCAASGDFKGWIIKLWPGGSGTKDTGQSGTKEVEDGEWTGKAILIIPQEYPDPPDTVEFDVVGTWDTGNEYDGMYFNYGGLPPIYSAHWYVDHSHPAGLDGDGGSLGERIVYVP
jgi:hypothetical protein